LSDASTDGDDVSQRTLSGSLVVRGRPSHAGLDNVDEVPRHSSECLAYWTDGWAVARLLYGTESTAGAGWNVVSDYVVAVVAAAAGRRRI